MLLLLEWRHRYVDASVLFVQLLLRKGYEKGRSKLFVLKHDIYRTIFDNCVAVCWVGLESSIIGCFKTQGIVKLSSLLK